MKLIIPVVAALAMVTPAHAALYDWSWIGQPFCGGGPNCPFDPLADFTASGVFTTDANNSITSVTGSWSGRDNGFTYGGTIVNGDGLFPAVSDGGYDIVLGFSYAGCPMTNCFRIGYDDNLPFWYDLGSGRGGMNGTLTAIDPPTETPLPAAWLMWLSGLVVLGLFRRSAVTWL